MKISLGIHRLKDYANYYNVFNTLLFYHPSSNSKSRQYDVTLSLTSCQDIWRIWVCNEKTLAISGWKLIMYILLFQTIIFHDSQDVETFLDKNLFKNTFKFL